MQKEEKELIAAAARLNNKTPVFGMKTSSEEKREHNEDLITSESAKSVVIKLNPLASSFGNSGSSISSFEAGSREKAVLVGHVQEKETVSDISASIFPSSTPMFPKTTLKPNLAPSKPKASQQKGSGEILHLKSGPTEEEEIIEIPIRVDTATKRAPVVIGKEKNIIRGDSNNIQVFSLGSAANINQDILNALQSGNMKSINTDNLKVTNVSPEMLLESRNNIAETSNSVNSIEELPAEHRTISDGIEIGNENTIPIQQMTGKIKIQPVSDSFAASFSPKQTINNVQASKTSTTGKRLTIRDYLLSLNGQNGIVVLPMSSVLPQKSTPTQSVALPSNTNIARNSNNVISQLAEYVVQEGLVDDLRKEVQQSRTNSPSNVGIDLNSLPISQVSAISLGNTAGMRTDLSNSQSVSVNPKPIDDESLLRLLASLPTGTLPQGGQTIQLQPSNIQTRQTSSTGKNPDLFRRTLSDFFFVKGQWIGTLIGGLMDLGEIFSDAIRQITNAGKKTR